LAESWNPFVKSKPKPTMTTITKMKVFESVTSTFLPNARQHYGPFASCSPRPQCPYTIA
jgi:hypothetical protein